MISGNTYEEVYEILSYMDKLTVVKVPKEILKIIKTKRNINFKTRINKNDIFNEDNVSKETIDFICWIGYKYWIDEKRKFEIDKINIEKVKKSEEEKREKYNPDNIFKSREIKYTEIPTSNITSMIEYKESVFKRVIDKIKSIFAKK